MTFFERFTDLCKEQNTTTTARGACHKECLLKIIIFFAITSEKIIIRRQP